MKNIARSLLLALVLIGLGYWAWGKFAGPAAPQPAESPAAANTMAHEVVVTYFTTDVRCESCQAIESLTRQTVEKRFGDELAAGKVRFAIHNIDQPENKHFTEEYELSFKTVVISDRNRGEERSWKKMDDVWILIDEPEEFMNYLASEIRACLDKPA
jgi:hypothetical protein